MTTWVEAREARRERLARERRYYTPDRLGPLCAGGCGLRVPVALVEAGVLAHPTCGRDVAALMAGAGS